MLILNFAIQLRLYICICYIHILWLKQFRSNRHIQVIMAADSKPFEDEVIQRELQREREKIARQAEEEAAEKQRANDKARKEMREW